MILFLVALATMMGRLNAHYQPPLKILFNARNATFDSLWVKRDEMLPSLPTEKKGSGMEAISWHNLFDLMWLRLQNGAFVWLHKPSTPISWRKGQYLFAQQMEYIVCFPISGFLLSSSASTPVLWRCVSVAEILMAGTGPVSVGNRWIMQQVD